MAIKEQEIPLADVLIETGMGIVAMNDALAENGVGATQASVKINFMASLSRGFDYKRENHSGGGAFTFWLIGGAGVGSYTRTELHQYSNYHEEINIEIDITFEPLPDTT
jgi:hypothetical protein